MTSENDPSSDYQESLQGRRKPSGESSAPESLGEAQTFRDRAPPNSDWSLGDAYTLDGTSYPSNLTDDTIEVVDLFARYKIEKTLGSGGMGEVLLATDSRLARQVAIKRILGDAARSRTAVHRFLTEAKAIAALNHPNIVQIYDYGRDKDGPFLVMEYVDGESLLERCRTGALPVEEAIELACQLCDGLGRAHSKGIIHRDIKPANILLTKDGTPKLTDFGLAKTEAADAGMTMTGMVLGTVDFMPPEQRQDATKVDARSDLWSLAATLYQMATGKSPRIIKFDNVPSGLKTVLGKALEDSRDARYQTASQFKEALRLSLREATNVQESEVGNCPNCGTTNPASRKFCRECGGSLEVNCLSCQGKILIWEKFCDHCGANQPKLVEQKRSELLERKAAAESLLKTHDYEAAVAIAAEFAQQSDPRLKHERSWGECFLSTIAEQQDSEIARIRTLLDEASKHRNAYDYQAAIRALEQVPEKLREYSIDGHSKTVSVELEELAAILKEIRRLSDLIKSRIDQKQLAGLLSEVEVLLAIQPSRADLLKLKDKLLDREKKLIVTRDESFAEAQLAFEQQNYSGCLASLSRIDPYYRDDKIRLLYQSASESSKQLSDLDAKITAAVANKAYEGLLEIVEQYLALNRDDPERQRLRQQLLVRLEKREVLATEVLGQAIEARNKGEYEAALSQLLRIPESLRTAEANSLERSCCDLQEAKCRAMDALQRNLKLGGGEGDCSEVKDYLTILTRNPEIKDSKFEQIQVEFQREREKYVKQAAEKRKRKDHWNSIVTAGFIGTAVLILIAVSVYTLHRNQRASYIAKALENGDYEAVLRLDSINKVALEMKQRAEAIQSATKLRDYETILRYDPGNSNALEMKKKADIEKALKAMDYTTVLQLDPDNANGLLMKKEADIKHALTIGDFEAALLIAPANTQALAMRKASRIRNRLPIRNSIGLELRLLPSGSFRMGERHIEHEVVISRAFYIGIYEVTQEEYLKITGSKPSKYDDGKAPVTQVSWDDANEFCRLLSELPEERAAGRVYRLPTEAEWEYACRAGTTTAYCFGDDESGLDEYAWFSGNSGGTTNQVGQKKCNAWGLFDMHGNAWEWCADWFSAYPQDSVTDPIGSEDGQLRVFRGGSWSSSPSRCRSAIRSKFVPAYRDFSGSIGFRVALNSSDNENTEFEAALRDETERHGAEIEKDPSAEIQQALIDRDYEAVLRLDPSNAQALGLKRTDEVYKSLAVGDYQKALKLDPRNPEALEKQKNAILQSAPIRNSIEMEFRLITAGTFLMGEGEGLHAVTLTKPFYIGIHEVTQAQYQNVMQQNPSYFQGPHNPVESVSWKDAVDFCKRLSEMPEEKAFGRLYRLPSEAEWEYVCRAGTSTSFSFGEDALQLPEYAWFEGNSERTHHPVGNLKSNPWGLYDLHGNVAEWCSDWLGDYPQGEVTDPMGPIEGSFRVVRGGVWGGPATACRSAQRLRFDPSRSTGAFGFRVVLSPSESSK